MQIRKNIAAIFREVNLLEYKSPGDYISIDDFYKVYGYACLYASFQEVPVTNLTISFVESRYPKKLIGHLKSIRKYTVEEKSPGIYTVIGDILPIQIIDSRRLSADENLWLRELHNGLAPQEIRRVITEAHRKGKAARIEAYLDAIIRANINSIEGAFEMSGTTMSLGEVLDRAGVLEKLLPYAEARGEATGEERRALAIAKNMISQGHSIEVIIAATSLDPEKVKSLYSK